MNGNPQTSRWKNISLRKERDKVTIAVGSYHRLLLHMGDLDHAFLTQRQKYSEDEGLTLLKVEHMSKSGLILLIIWLLK